MRRGRVDGRGVRETKHVCALIVAECGAEDAEVRWLLSCDDQLTICVIPYVIRSEK